jgi:hypothetical protein
MARAARDHRLIDAIEQRIPEAVGCKAWRVVRDGRDPLQSSVAGGRWDDRTFDVLYTSTRADGAIAEMYFHLARGQPVFPSQVRYRLFELNVRLASCLRLDSMDALSSIGLVTATFGQMSYSEREQEYPNTEDRRGGTFPGLRRPDRPECSRRLSQHRCLLWSGRAGCTRSHPGSRFDRPDPLASHKTRLLAAPGTSAAIRCSVGRWWPRMLHSTVVTPASRNAASPAST